MFNLSTSNCSGILNTEWKYKLCRGCDALSRVLLGLRIPLDIKMTTNMAYIPLIMGISTSLSAPIRD